jgi:membrane protease subunit HflK
MDNKDNQPALEYFAKALRLSFNALKIIVAGLVIYYLLLSGLFTVKQDEVALILRWGRIAGAGEGRVLEPGFHWSFPEPIDKVIRIPIKVKSLEIEEFWTSGLDNPQASPPPSLIPYLHGYCITGDNNLIHMRWQVFYNITDPISYVKNVQDEEKLIKSVISNAVIETVGNFPVDEALRAKLEEITTLVRRSSQKELDKLDSGITLSTTVHISRSVPPLQVVQAFNDVTKAEQTKSTLINEGKTYENRVVNTAKGEASVILAEAETYRSGVVNETLADAKYIQELTQKFGEGSKELQTYLSYFYQEKMEEILSRLEGKFVLQTPILGKENELRIILGKETKWEGIK